MGIDCEAPAAAPRREAHVNTEAIALAHRNRLSWDRLRGLYNGVGYVVAVSLFLDVWWSLQYAMPQLVAGHGHDFLRSWFAAAAQELYGMIPGPILVPIVVNLAPRAGVARVAYLFAAAIPMGWWCLSVAGNVSFGWNWSSLGFLLDGLLTTSLVVGVCAYHTYSREAADSLMRSQIERTRLTAELQRAQLRLLHAQIEPHFLFNTLSVVRALARTDRAATVVMLDNLIRYFAAALPRLRDSNVPLAQELQLVEAYLAIYRARMGTRLEYEIVAAEDLAQARVPSMALLTLVENALKHGVTPSVEGGFIRVSAARDAETLRLVVADSGRGLELRQGRGVGLANIRQRLRMMYGASATLSLKPAEPRGVVASICIPVQGCA
jgi:two-component sensor histidine kinase